MEGLRTRRMPLRDAVAVLQAELAGHGLSAEVVERERGGIGVTRCVLRDSRGRVVARSSGRGSGAEAAAGALFEAWEHHCHKSGFAAFRDDGTRMRRIPAGEIAGQPALADDALVHRLAADLPNSRIACLRFDPVHGDADPLWYPGFARFPWYLQYPVVDDGTGYHAYLRYATNFGTAAGTSEPEALLHALLEAVEGDALSHALLDWYADPGGRPRRVRPDDLPADLRRLCDDVEQAIGCSPLILETTTGLGIPAFHALPSRPAHLGVGGGGASPIPAHALARALGELVQAHVTVTEDPDRDRHLRRRLDRLGGWPLLRRCATLDPGDLIARSEHARSRPRSWWEAAGTDPGVAARLAAATGALAREGFRCYYVRWNERDSPVPVVTVLVPGFETFFLSRSGIPVLPTGRGARRLLRESARTDRAAAAPVPEAGGAPIP
ncbi:YcaO-like family protein [Planomonospora alba]|uniref:YcaO-like family protein n=1 Tax=Planomonospora alba TaxID=161354 RepID=A0ABP6MKS5_9ACTN